MKFRKFYYLETAVTKFKSCRKYLGVRLDHKVTSQQLNAPFQYQYWAVI